ncbi:TetR/AcrR family transcriptional regulator [Ornithinimicrobium panacihumi]|uniref:TetR/AcrR family transcriptional regulator n=1 Tax=Ornithinimicrobium panacihumi TaxID=2008449 RepID=UPI003F8BD53F
MHSKGGTAPEPDALLQLWGLADLATKGPRARADIHAVAAAGVAVADREGFEAVTLARVAAELGLTTTALYRYVDSKSTLVECMVDAALGPAPRLRARSGPRRLESWVRALWARYEAHPWLGTFPLERPPRSPHALAWVDLLVSELSDAGTPDPLGSALAVDVLVRGYAGLSRVAAHAAPPSPELGGEMARRYPSLLGGPGREGDVLDDLVRAVHAVSGSAGA